MKIETAIQFALDGDAIILFGSDFSVGGMNYNGEEIPVGAELSQILCNDMGIAYSDNLSVSCSRYMNDEKVGKEIDSLIEILENQTICHETDDTQLDIFDVPWKRIYTMNFDSVPEMAAKNLRIFRKSIDITKSKYTGENVLDGSIIHINGYVMNIDASDFKEEFKLADENYVRNGLVKNSWYSLFETDLQRAKTVFFFGYSMEHDQDILLLLARLGIRGKCFFINSTDMAEDKSSKLSAYGDAVPIGAQGFASIIKSVGSGYVPKVKRAEPQGFSRREPADYENDNAHSQTDIENLFIKGTFDKSYLNQHNYCVKRNDKIQDVKKALKENKVVIVQSKLGNGKSIFLEELANDLCEKSNVFFLENLQFIHSDLEALAADKDKENVLIIDDCGNYRKLLQTIVKETGLINFKLILSSRTAVNTQLYYDLIEKYNFEEEKLSIIDLDVMNSHELNALVEVMNEGKLWGNYNGLNNSKKEKRLANKYGASMAQLFYLMIDAEAIQSQIKEIIDCALSENELKELMVYQAINSIFSLKLSFPDTCRFLQISEESLNGYRMNLSARKLIDFEKNQFMINSSVFSLYILKTDNFRNIVTDILKKLYTASSVDDLIVQKYRILRKNLISRANMRLMFVRVSALTPEDEKYIFEFYNGIKEVQTAEKDPYFWMEFGITALKIGEYEISRANFENAYQQVQSGLMDDFVQGQLDAYYARFLLCNEICVNKHTPATAMRTFEKAHGLLMNAGDSVSNLRYVLHQAGIYCKFYETFRVLPEDSKRKILDLAYEMLPNYRRYFEKNKLFAIPENIINSYKEFRKLFEKTPLIVNFKEIDKVLKVKMEKQK